MKLVLFARLLFVDNFWLIRIFFTFFGYFWTSKVGPKYPWKRVRKWVQVAFRIKYGSKLAPFPVISFFVNFKCFSVFRYFLDLPGRFKISENSLWVWKCEVYPIKISLIYTYRISKNLEWQPRTSTASFYQLTTKKITCH